MAEDKRALVLHIVGTQDPILIALTPEAADQLAPQLVGLLQGGDRHAVTAADGTSIAINFTHVVTAHIDVLPSMARAYGDPGRRSPNVTGLYS